jgi:ABC-type sugar transport system permease subunit
MLSPTTFTAVLLSIVGSFQSVDLIYIVTQGRPGNSTHVLIYYIYQQGITSWKIGYGSALSSVLFAALLIFTVIYIFIGEKRVHYDR